MITPNNEVFIKYYQEKNKLAGKKNSLQVLSYMLCKHCFCGNKSDKLNPHFVRMKSFRKAKDKIAAR